jgi:hypothetical protein
LRIIIKNESLLKENQSPWRITLKKELKPVKYFKTHK